MSKLDSVKFDEFSQEKHDYLKPAFKYIERTIEGLDRSRAKDIALDRLTEASMWVNIAISEEQKYRGT